MLIVVYALALGVKGAYLMLVLVVFGVAGVAGLVALLLTVNGPVGVVTAEGFKIRATAFSTGLTTVPWEDVHAAWFAYFGSQRSLHVLVQGRDRAYLVPVAEDTAPVAAAVHELSGGQVAVAETPPPRPKKGAGYGRGRRTPLIVGVMPWVALLVLLPWLTGTPQLWDQPWWPGN
ncbi:hypothetical protein [Dactylosporangium sp. NPDC005555]|uniref:hypothetical protein n=1 Tax=Dactylosporangium sp. NPDC005555 TaxID=3154889 RepID=UPI0033AF134E